MKFLTDLKKKEYGTIIGIDASTHVVGFAVLRQGVPVAVGRITLNQKEVYDRLKDLRLRVSVLIDRYHPEFMMIESPIMVQNPLTTKNLSYAAGIIISTAIDRNLEVDEVTPMEWKTWIGYKKITKKIRESIIDRMGTIAANKEIQRLRKSQVQDILMKRYPDLVKQLTDDNISDALAIALYADFLLKSSEEVKI